ncbi:MAG TPA: glycosyltransferase [Bryobacteraceae bacterium]|nr:glycosyltransferase [Bryobacteraceae bacterium]
MPSISFLIVTRDEAPTLLDATIKGVLETSTGYSREIVVVDDASAVPISVDHPDVRVFRNETSIGTCRSRRKAASESVGDILVSLDAHMSFEPGWLEHMLAHVHSGALLCASWWNYELTRPLCWGADFLWCGERDYHAGRCPGFSFRHRTRCPGEEAVEVPMLIGACYMMLRNSYERIGGFSPFFRTWGRLEQDLSLRAWITGLGVKCVPTAHVGHFSRAKFPYPVRWEDIEFNQLATVRTVFEESTARAFEQFLQPFPQQVHNWLAETDFYEWRESIQRVRRMSDSDFFQRFVPAAPECLRQAELQLT